MYWACKDKERQSYQVVKWKQNTFSCEFLSAFTDKQGGKAWMHTFDEYFMYIFIVQYKLPLFTFPFTLSLAF